MVIDLNSRQVGIIMLPIMSIDIVACGMFSLLSRENKIVFATWIHRCYIYIMTTRLFYNNIVNNTPW